MNQGQAYMDAAQSYPPPSGPASSMPQHSGYGQPQALQPAAHGYGPSAYGGYSYAQTMPPMTAGHPVTSSMGPQMMAQSLPLPTMAPVPQQAQAQGAPYAFDTTGQMAPHGMKPRVTATLWEDEGSLCFQVEANGVCVARREDNHMINGTKLLNVAGMTRGRRDGILKSEKTRHVVKIGPMHLKGVWIPFDRALDFANKEKITEQLYPLFVHNIGALLYHPTNQGRPSISNASMAARRPDQSAPEYIRTPQGTQPPSLTHHHSMTTPAPGSVPPPHSIAPHPASGRPGLDRAHTFPTPPTSASSLTMGMGNSGNSYEYGSQHQGQPLALDTGMSARTVPTSPAATPPSHTQGMQYQTSQSYDSRQMYSAPASYSHYGTQQGMPRYSAVQSSPGGVKHEMGPPTRGGAENDQVEQKAHDGYGAQQEADGEHEGDYTHTSASYGARRPSYSYKPNPAPGPMHADAPQSHISPEMTHSPHQNGGSGRATPRSAATYAGYSATPQRAQQLPSSNLYNVMSQDTRAGAPNGADSYAQQNGYQQPPPQYPSAMNGAPPSNKRMRDVEDDEGPYSANGTPDLKRQRTEPGAVRPISQPHSVKAGGARR